MVRPYQSIMCGDTVYWNWALEFPVIIQYGKIKDIIDDDIFTPYKIYVLETGTYLPAVQDPFIFSSVEECMKYYHKKKKKIPKECISVADWPTGQDPPKRRLNGPLPKYPGIPDWDPLPQ